MPRGPPRHNPAQALWFLGFPPDLSSGLFFNFSVVPRCLILALLNIPGKAPFVPRLNGEVTQSVDWFKQHTHQREVRSGPGRTGAMAAVLGTLPGRYAWAPAMASPLC